MVADVKNNERFLGGTTSSTPPTAETTEYRRIALIVDDSKLAELAVPRATELAIDYNAELIIMRILKPIDQRGVLAIKDPAIAKQAHLKAENEAKSLAYKLIKQGVAARSYVVKGSEITAACPYIQSENADLVVVAQPIVKRWSHVLFGDALVNFRQRATVPVLFVGREE